VCIDLGDSGSAEVTTCLTNLLEGPLLHTGTNGDEDLARQMQAQEDATRRTLAWRSINLTAGPMFVSADPTPSSRRTTGKMRVLAPQLVISSANSTPAPQLAPPGSEVDGPVVVFDSIQLLYPR